MFLYEGFSKAPDKYGLVMMTSHNDKRLQSNTEQCIALSGFRLRTMYGDY